MNSLLQAIHKKSPYAGDADYQTYDHRNRWQRTTDGLPRGRIVPGKSLLWRIALWATVVVRLRTYRTWLKFIRRELKYSQLDKGKAK